MDLGGRAKQEARIEDAQERLSRNPEHLSTLRLRGGKW